MFWKIDDSSERHQFHSIIFLLVSLIPILVYPRSHHCGIHWDYFFFCVLQWKKEMASHDGPPGYDPPATDVKTKTKSAKRNERKKEKRLQVCHPL